MQVKTIASLSPLTTEFENAFAAWVMHEANNVRMMRGERPVDAQYAVAYLRLAHDFINRHGKIQFVTI